jgi:histidinol-phosphate phosphatase family protein
MYIKQAVILCGGMGERLRPITEIIPKPMVDINDKPFLEVLINQLKEQGINEFILCTGYKKEIIEDYFKDGSKFGVKIKYSRGETEWEQAKRLWEARDLIDDFFLLLYADNYVPSFDLKKSMDFYLEKSKIISLVIFSKLEKNNLKLDENNLIIVYDKTRMSEGLKYVELGYMIVDKKKIFEFIDNSNVSFQETMKKLVEKKEIAGLETKYKYQSISDLDRLKKTREYFSKKKILLIDRDGVINKKASKGEYILKEKDFIFIEDSVMSMKELSKKGFSFIIITNQPSISKGLSSKEDLEKLHEFMVNKLRTEGINIIDIFYCPHNVDDECYCRKPKPGLIIDACNKYLINPKDTYFIGDDERDCLAAVRAGCGSILIGKDYDLSLNVKYHNVYVNPDFSSTKLSEILECIIKKFSY